MRFRCCNYIDFLKKSLQYISKRHVDVGQLVTNMKPYELMKGKIILEIDRMIRIGLMLNILHIQVQDRTCILSQETACLNGLVKRRT